MNQYGSLPFTGNPQTILLNCQPEGEEKKPEKAEDADSDEEDVVKIEPKNYLEEDRLAYTVQAIENDCQLVPVGAFRMIPAHEVRYNDQFQGLSPKNFSLNSFVHFRYPESASAKEKIGSYSLMQRVLKLCLLSIFLTKWETQPFGLHS